MNRLLVTLMCTASIMAATSAEAAVANNWYLGLTGDLTWMRHTDTGGGGNVALGYRVAPSASGDWRLELEGGYHGADGDGSSSGTHYLSYMGNAYYDFNANWAVTNGWTLSPYIGGGVGDAQLHFGNDNNNVASTFHHHDNTFAYQGMAGLSLASAGPVWSLGYRYLGTDSHDVNSNSLELGVRFNF